MLGRVFNPVAILAALGVLFAILAGVSPSQTTGFWWTGTSNDVAAQPSSPLDISYASNDFRWGDDGQVLAATVTGGFGSDRSFSVSGSVPPSVSYNTNNGDFTGPGFIDWRMPLVAVRAGGGPDDTGEINAGFTCAISAFGDVYCWGHNNRGQLGNGTTTDSLVYSRVLGLPPTAKAVELATSGAAACAVLDDGSAWCWGKAIQNGTSQDQLTAVEFDREGKIWLDVEAGGGGHFCAIYKPDATSLERNLVCWGRNSRGQLGDGTTTERLSPGVDVSALASEKVTKLAVGRSHTCALTGSKKVYCWGQGLSGQLGQGNSQDSYVPLEVPNLNIGIGEVTDMAASNDGTCIVKLYPGGLPGGPSEQYTVPVCFGNNNNYTLGLPNTQDYQTATIMADSDDSTSARSRILTLDLGNDYGCATLFNPDEVRCWGRTDNVRKQLGPGPITTPFWNVISGFPDSLGLIALVDISAGNDNHVCVLSGASTIQGTPYCWGNNTLGQLGNGTTSEGEPSPVIATGTGKMPGIPGTVQSTVSDAGGSDTAQVNFNIVPPDPATLTYANTSFNVRSNNQELFPTTTGGVGDRTYFISSGDLPPGVTFDSGTGKFTGPDAASWGGTATALVGNWLHFCALMPDTTVKCWGGRGALGNGSFEDALVPVDVSGLSGVRALAATYNATCAVRFDGTVWCWGSNLLGELGDGNGGPSSSASSVPVEVPGLTDVKDIGAGTNHFCALINDARVKCWGNNEDGQVGNGTAGGIVLTPTDVSGLTDVKSLAGGGSFTCALLSVGGNVKCWGTGYIFGNETSQRLTPQTMVTSSIIEATQITAGDGHFCALRPSGQVECMGLNSSGQIGNDTTVSVFTPTTVRNYSDPSGFLSDVTYVSAGPNSTCAATADDELYCWGQEWDWGAYDASGEDPAIFTKVPVQVSSVGGWTGDSGVAYVASMAHARGTMCALLSNGKMVCAGRGYLGRLGNGSQDYSYYATAVSGFDTRGFPKTLEVGVASSITGGAMTEITLYAAPGQLETTFPGTVFTFGGNLEELPYPITYGGDLRYERSYSVSGTLPPGVTFDSVSGLFTGPAAEEWNFLAVDISMNGNNGCAVTNEGTVKCWGNNTWGQLGDGNTGGFSAVPVDVVGLTGVQEVAVGNGHVCARTGTGTSAPILCWGKNDRGQLGNNTTTNSSVPVSVQNSDGQPITLSYAFGAGGSTSCATVFLKRLMCWGDNTYGQLGPIPAELGNPDFVDNAVVLEFPFNIDSPNFSRGVSVGETHVCAYNDYFDSPTGLDSSGLLCWGDNSKGQLGNGTTTGTRNVSPRYVETGVGDGTWQNIAAGNKATCAYRPDGNVKCWGDNVYGRVGAGTTSTANPFYTSPETVLDITDVVGITLGDNHTCAVKSNGAVKCWGRGGSHELGVDSRSNSSTPVSVTDMSSAVMISAGDSFTCALLASEAVQCWGSDNFNGNLGIGSPGLINDSYIPLTVSKSGPDQPGFPANLTITTTRGSGTGETQIQLTNVIP